MDREAIIGWSKAAAVILVFVALIVGFVISACRVNATRVWKNVATGYIERVEGVVIDEMEYSFIHTADGRTVRCYSRPDNLVKRGEAAEIWRRCASGQCRCEIRPSSTAF